MVSEWYYDVLVKVLEHKKRDRHHFKDIYASLLGLKDGRKPLVTSRDVTAKSLNVSSNRSLFYLC